MKAKPQTVTRAMSIAAIFVTIVFGFGLSAARAQVDPGQPSYRTLVSEVTALQNEVTQLEDEVAALKASSIPGLSKYVRVDKNDENGLKGPRIILHDANVQIESGSGNTVDSTGLGNLVIGYDEDSGEAGGEVGDLACPDSSAIDDNRTGSHNLIIGDCNQFTSSGGLVAGFANLISGSFASVSGGERNTASDGASSVSGGRLNIASGTGSSVSGGSANEASGKASSVSGGVENLASGIVSSVSGGAENVAGGYGSSILGGSSIGVNGLNGTSP